MLTIMPQSEGKILGVRLSGDLTEEDYLQVLHPRIVDMVPKYGDNIRLMLFLEEDAKDLTMGAALAHETHGLKHTGLAVYKLAVVGGDRKHSVFMKVDAHLKSVEIEFWEREKANEAWTWLDLGIV